MSKIPFFTLFTTVLNLNPLSVYINQTIEIRCKALPEWGCHLTMVTV